MNNEFGQAYAEAFEAAAEENGLDIVATETIEATDSGAPSGQVTNLVAANPDTILAVPLGAQCIAFMTEIGNQKAANADFDASIYQTATCANPVFFGAVTNGGADGVFTSQNLKDVNDPDVAANDPGAVAYLEAFAATGSDADPGGIAGAGWESMEVAVKAIQEAADAGNLSREGIINAAAQRQLLVAAAARRSDVRDERRGRLPRRGHAAAGLVGREGRLRSPG